jgi:hypothetical protein
MVAANDLFNRAMDEVDKRMVDAPLAVHLNPYVAICVLGSLQLALRHPMNCGAAAHVARTFADKLQAYLAQTPALAEVVEQGWHDDYDVAFSVAQTAGGSDNERTGQGGQKPPETPPADGPGVKHDPPRNS